MNVISACNKLLYSNLLDEFEQWKSWWDYPDIRILMLLQGRKLPLLLLKHMISNTID